jgi:hypothetical protein
MQHAQEHCHGEESTCQVRVQVFSSHQIPVALSTFPNNTVDSPVVLVQWIHSELSWLRVFGCPLLGSSCTSSCPSVNSLCHSKTHDLFKGYSPQAIVDRAIVSLALLPIFTQNLMFIRCYRFLSLIFPSTIYHRHVLLPLLLENEQLIWPVARVNASWNMSRC